MRRFILTAILLTQTACATVFDSMTEAYKLGHADQRGCRPNDTFKTCQMYQFDRDAKARNEKQWSKWDKNRVSDDVILVDIFDKNSKILATGQAR